MYFSLSPVSSINDTFPGSPVIKTASNAEGSGSPGQGTKVLYATHTPPCAPPPQKNMRYGTFVTVDEAEYSP